MRISRDPAGRWGGFNTYGFVANSPVDKFDVYGLGPVGSIGSGAEAKQRCQDVIDWKKKAGKLVITPLKPKGLAACTKAIQNLIATDQAVKDTWAMFDPKTCPPPKIDCVCCTKGYGGWYKSGTKPGEITICWNNVQKKLGTVLVHEATHYLQFCYGKGGGGCKGSIKRELEAYWCAKQCTDFGNCLYRALGSSCGGWCKNPDDVAAMFNDLKTWFGNEQANFCKYGPPAPPAP